MFSSGTEKGLIKNWGKEKEKLGENLLKMLSKSALFFISMPELSPHLCWTEILCYALLNWFLTDIYYQGLYRD